MLRELLHFFFLAPSIVERTRIASLYQPSDVSHLPTSSHILSQRHSLLAFPLFARPRGSPEKDEGNRPPPIFNPDDKAVDVFDNVYFYVGKEACIELFREEREDTLQNMTVKEVYLKYTVESGKGEIGLTSLACDLSARENSVLKYYADLKLSLEDRLAAMKIIDLSGQNEFTLFNRRYPCDNPTATNIYTATSTKPNSTYEIDRNLRLGLVLGPSGSGKTSFTFQFLAPRFLVGSATKQVGIYLQAKDADVQFNQETRDDAASALVAWIKTKITKRTKIDFPETPLDMHVCLIIDEAGTAEVKWWFEDETMLRALCAAAKELATSVAVVVSGTGLTGNSISSSDDAYVFRMQPWQADDIAMILGNYKKRLNLVEQEETTQTVADAIFSNPKLGALATNARSAFFLVRAIQQHSPFYCRLSWSSLLDHLTKTLVTEVVEEYIGSNGINSLSKIEQRHVAASIFRAFLKLNEYEVKLPNLVEMETREMTVAESLLQFNCELVNGTLNLLPGERFAFTVTPAIAIVLFAMAGVPATMTPGWKAEEELAALFAIQKWYIDCMETYLGQRNDQQSKNKLDRSLEQCRLIPLQQQLKSAKTNDDKISIPIVGPGAVLLNGDRAPFADVIAPFMLIQAKRETSTPTAAINLHEEMGKCSLLKSMDSDTRVLQGLVDMWRGHLELTIPSIANPEKKSRRLLQQGGTDRSPQDSVAFPANLLSLVPQSEPVQYAVIEGNDIIVGNVKRPLPSLYGTTITFMVSTNVDSIRLTLSSTEPTKITITESNLDKDLQIRVETLSQSDRAAWTRFVEDEVREGIVIKFLLTKSA